MNFLQQILYNLRTGASEQKTTAASASVTAKGQVSEAERQQVLAKDINEKLQQCD